MMAILRYIDDLYLDTQATLLYCVRTEKDIIFHHELGELQQRLKNFQFHVLLSQPDPEWTGAQGRINRDFVAKAVPELSGRVFFVCGPPAFMETVREILTELGVGPQQIRQEIFGRPALQPAAIARHGAEGAFTIEFVRSGKVSVVQQSQTLLQAAMENGIDIPSACRQGQCGTCRARLLDGQVQMSAEQGLDQDSKARGFILTCVAHAQGNVKLDR
jgi:ferredoxin-NADP reductase